MARHKAPRTPAARRALAVLATAGAALGAGATTAAAGVLPDSPGQVVGTVADLKPNPLAGTGVDPLDNGVGTQVADFRAVDSRAVTGPVAQAPSVGGIPGAGQVTGLLRG